MLRSLLAVDTWELSTSRCYLVFPCSVIVLEVFAFKVIALEFIVLKVTALKSNVLKCHHT